MVEELNEWRDRVDFVDIHWEEVKRRKLRKKREEILKSLLEIEK